MRRLVTAILAVATLLALGTSTVHAQSPQPSGATGDGGTSKAGDGVTLFDPTGTNTTGRTGSSNSRPAAYDPNAYVCQYVRQVNSAGYERVADAPAGASTGASMNKICGRAADVRAALGRADPANWFVDNCIATPQGCGATYGLWVAAPPTPAELAQILRDRLDVSAPSRLQTSPEANRLYVRFPTWFWITGGPGVAEPISEDAGDVVVKATPTFRWSTGEGVEDCVGKGTPYDPARYAAGAESPCGHVYQRPGHFTLTLTVTWTFDWYEAGVLRNDPPLAPTIFNVSQDVEVREIQGIVTDVR
jgi:hypothetical protein